MAYGPQDIQILEWYEAVRRRPRMYVGLDEANRSMRARLLEAAVSDIAHDLPAEIRILLWRDDTVTIAYDGHPLPVEPLARPGDDVPHPALYHLFTTLGVEKLFFAPS